VKKRIKERSGEGLIVVFEGLLLVWSGEVRVDVVYVDNVKG
jgi:hypothetical protein